MKNKIKIRLSQDMRGIKEKSQGSIRLVITRGNMRAMIDLNISVPVKNWDGKN